MSLLNLDAFRRTPLIADPFEHLIVPEFIRPFAIAEIMADYPRIRQGGSFPLSSLGYGPAFERLAQELRGPAMRAAFAEKFDLDLSDRPTTLTVRGICRPKDGKIHVDSKSKLITVLIYMNDIDSGDRGGHLRLLQSDRDIHDFAKEVPPSPGKLLCFRNGPTAWHGHTSFSGVRQVLQLNWVTDNAAVRKSERRHGFSAMLKRINPFRRAA